MKIDENILTDEGKVICDLTNIFTNKNREIERLSRTITDYDELLMQKNNVIDKAIEILQDYDLVENKDKVISDTFKALRGEDND